MGSPRECTRILGLDGFRVERLEWKTDGTRTRVRIWIERRGIRGYECSGCRRRTWRVRDQAADLDDLPWAKHPVTLVYAQRRVWCRTCRIRTERVAFAEGHPRIRLDCAKSSAWIVSRCRQSLRNHNEAQRAPAARPGFFDVSRECAQTSWALVAKNARFSPESVEGGGLLNRSEHDRNATNRAKNRHFRPKNCRLQSCPGMSRSADC
jgi:transposase